MQKSYILFVVGLLIGWFFIFSVFWTSASKQACSCSNGCNWCLQGPKFRESGNFSKIWSCDCKKMGPTLAAFLFFLTDFPSLNPGCGFSCWDSGQSELTKAIPSLQLEEWKMELYGTKNYYRDQRKGRTQESNLTKLLWLPWLTTDFKKSLKSKVKPSFYFQKSKKKKSKINQRKQKKRYNSHMC